MDGGGGGGGGGGYKTDRCKLAWNASGPLLDWQQAPFSVIIMYMSERPNTTSSG